MPIPIKATISGSSAATILGLNKWATPFEAWQKIMEQIEPGFNSLNGYLMPEFEENAAIRFGNCFESANIAITEEKLGVKITDQERVFKSVHKGAPVSCHIDGLIDLDGKKLYEGKTTSIMAYRSKWDKERNMIPVPYDIQGHHNMALAEMCGVHIDEAIFSVLVFPETPEKWEETGWEVKEVQNKYYLVTEGSAISPLMDTAVDPIIWATTLNNMGFHHIYRIPRNDELINTMLEKYSLWWEKYIIGRQVPEPMNIDDIKRMCPEVSGTIVVDNEQLIGYIEEYREISAEIKPTGNMGKRKEQLKVLFLDGCRKLNMVIDDESADKWIFRDSRGHKLGSYGKTAKGNWSFR